MLNREDLSVIANRASKAATSLALASTDEKNLALQAMTEALRMRAEKILDANARDVLRARQNGLRNSLVDRLILDEARLESMAVSIAMIGQLPDPVGRELARWQRPNGLELTRVSVPIGVIGMIFESRPNVVADASALCLKSGNACILRGGSDCFETSMAIVEGFQLGLKGLPLHTSSIQMIPTTDREAVGEMLKGLGGKIDLIIPRGGKSLVERVQREARVPVLSHLEGICHTFVDRDADIEMATNVVFNAKMRRTGICGATETLLVDRGIANRFLPLIIQKLAEAGCEVRGDHETQEFSAAVVPATEQDWQTEYLDAVLSIRVVEEVEVAIAHIEQYGSHHTDAIITGNPTTAEKFLREVSSAIVLHNASTQFADGGEFGFGAEIGIATGKLHARGPVGLEQLNTFKYQVRGTGQMRN